MKEGSGGGFGGEGEEKDGTFEGQDHGIITKVSSLSLLYVKGKIFPKLMATFLFLMANKGYYMR